MTSTLECYYSLKFKMAVAGSWSSWSVVPGVCSGNCDFGTSVMLTRQCSNPEPENRGQGCHGVSDMLGNRPWSDCGLEGQGCQIQEMSDSCS